MENKAETNVKSKGHYFLDRDISWLSFNERVLMEAEKKTVPLFERLNFLSIFSSNLDEFYRVRMPALTALHRLYGKQIVDEGSAATPWFSFKTNKVRFS